MKKDARLVPRWQRLVYSIVSVILAAVIASVGATLVDHRSVNQIFFSEILIFGGYSCICAVPGWIVAIPVIMLVRNFQGWRAWTLLAVGTSIGPLVMFAAAFCIEATSESSVSFTPAARNLVCFATASSFLSSGSFLLLMRLARARRLANRTIGNAERESA